jgi:antitoxin component of RelBE/YafQ-DinJ toxin-antitoxin module
MKSDRFQIRLDPKLKEQATRVLRRRHTTVTDFITQALRQLVESDTLERRVGRSEEAEQV